MSTRQTHTYAVLKVSQSAYDEIRQKLQTAAYDHAFYSDGIIDMQGIAILPEDMNLGKAYPVVDPGKGKYSDPSRRFE